MEFALFTHCTLIIRENFEVTAGQRRATVGWWMTHSSPWSSLKAVDVQKRGGWESTPTEGEETLLRHKYYLHDALLDFLIDVQVDAVLPFEEFSISHKVSANGHSRFVKAVKKIFPSVSLLDILVIERRRLKGDFEDDREPFGEQRKWLSLGHRKTSGLFDLFDILWGSSSTRRSLINLCNHLLLPNPRQYIVVFCILSYCLETAIWPRSEFRLSRIPKGVGLGILLESCSALTDSKFNCSSRVSVLQIGQVECE